jgi:oligopeptide transport system substrate-binding protein
MMVAAIALAGCGGEEPSGGAGKDSASAPAERVLRINLGAEPKTLDPGLITVIPDNKALHALMEGLVYLDEKAEPLPGVALSWTPSPDFRSWTFNLRPDAKWHNGDSVTSQDFSYAIRRVLTKSVAADYASMVQGFLVGSDEYYAGGGLESQLPFKGIETPDSTTITYHLKQPTPYFPTVVAWACWLPVHQKTVETAGPGWANDAKTYVGNGAFRMESYRSGDRLVTRKADTYWDKQTIYWDKIELFMITDSSTEIAAFSSGELDITQSVALPEINNWRGKPEFHAPEGLASYYALFNTTAAPFDDARVRRAFSLCIDRDLLSTRVTRRGEKPAQGLIPASMPGAGGGTFREAAGTLIGAANVEEARRLLAEAGYGPGGKNLPPLEYIYNTLDEHRIIGEQLQAMWKEGLGADVRLQNMENGVLLGRLNSGDFQIARSSWVADYIDPMTFLEIFEKGNGYNRSRMDNARFNELIEKARQEADPVLRQQFFVEMERIVVQEEVAVAPLHDFVFALLIQTSLENVGVNKMAGLNYVRSRRRAE